MSHGFHRNMKPHKRFQHQEEEEEEEIFAVNQHNYNDFWRIMWHWRLENYDMHHSNQLHVTYTQKTVIFVILFQYITVFTEFLIKLMQPRWADFFLFQKHKNLTNLKLLNGILPENAMHLTSVYKDEEM